MTTAAIVGASGYAGAELLRLLDAHPTLEATTLTAHQQVGSAVADVFPNLQGHGFFADVDVDDLADHDVVFIATPDGPAMDLVPALAATDALVVDLSAAYRLPADVFAHFYGREHSHPDDTPAVYGLTEFAREDVTGASVVANPGCYVTTALLSLVPVASLLDLSTLVVDGKSGTSGAGRGVKPGLHVSHVTNSVGAYGVAGHRHTPEIEVHLSRLAGVAEPRISFTPHLLPMVRGLLTTSVATLAEGVTADDLHSALVDQYADEPFVTVLEPGTQPVTKAVLGSNSCHIAVAVDPRTNRATLTSVTDNLVKGAAGQALQNANLMLGLDDATALPTIGTYP